MKIENFKNVDELLRLQDNYKRATESLKKVKSLKARKELHLSDGGVTPRGSVPLYNLHINDYPDGSGELMNFDLTGLLMHFELLEFLEETLEHKIHELEKRIKEL